MSFISPERPELARPDLEVIRDAASTTDERAVADLGAAGDAGEAADHDAAADAAVVADLAEVVDLAARTDDRRSELPAVDVGVGTELDVVTDLDMAQGDLAESTPSGSGR